MRLEDSSLKKHPNSSEVHDGGSVCVGGKLQMGCEMRALYQAFCLKQIRQECCLQRKSGGTLLLENKNNLRGKQLNITTRSTEASLLPLPVCSVSCLPFSSLVQKCNLCWISTLHIQILVFAVFIHLVGDLQMCWCVSNLGYKAL